MSFNCKKLFVYAVSLYTWGSKVGGHFICPQPKTWGVMYTLPPRIALLLALADCIVICQAHAMQIPRGAADCQIHFQDGGQSQIFKL